MFGNMAQTTRRGRTPNYSYTKLCDAKPNTDINVYAVIRFYKQPYKTRGTDYCHVLSIVDPTYHTHNKLTCVLFMKQESACPPCRVGSIIRIHRLKIIKHGNELQGNSGPGFSWLLFDSDINGSTQPYASSSQNYTLLDTDTDIHGNAAVKKSTDCLDMLREMREWVNNEPDFSQKDDNQRLVDMQVGNYGDVVCQVVGRSLLPSENCVVLHVWDGTQPINQVRVVDLEDATEVKKDSRLWQTADSFVYDIMLFDDHYRSASTIQPGEIVKFRNLHLVQCRTTPSHVTHGNLPPVELIIHRGMSYGRGIIRLPSDTFESRALRGRLETIKHLHTEPEDAAGLNTSETSDYYLRLLDSHILSLMPSASNNQLSVCTPSTSPYQPPTTTYQPPATTHQPPATAHQPPATAHQPPGTEHQPPTTAHQPHTTANQPSTSAYQPSSPLYQPASTLPPFNPMHQTPTSTNEPSISLQPPLSTPQQTTFEPQSPMRLSSCDTCNVQSESETPEIYEYETFRNILDTYNLPVAGSEHCMLKTNTVVCGHYDVGRTTLADVISSVVPWKHKVLCYILDYVPRIKDPRSAIKLYCPHCHYICSIPDDLAGKEQVPSHTARLQLRVSHTDGALPSYECPQCSLTDTAVDSTGVLAYIYMFKLVLVDKTGWVVANLWNHNAETFFAGQCCESMVRDPVKFEELTDVLDRICLGPHKTRDDCLIECCLKSFTSGEKVNFEIFDTKLIA